MPRVALIIVTYNSEKFLPELLFSLRNMKEPEGGVRMIFVDNASDDNSVPYLRDHTPQAIVIKEPKNLGFSAAINTGIRHPSARDAEYIALLNPDTAVTPNWLTELVSVFDGDTGIASAQPLLLYHQDKNKINSAGNMIHFLGFGFTDGNGKPLSVILNGAGSFDFAQDDRKIYFPVTYASGAAVLYRKKWLDEIGGFDNDLFMYHDDLDVGWKFLLRGHRNMLVPSSIVYHHYEFSRSIKKYYWMERNRLMLLLTHYRYGTLLLLSPALLALELGLIAFSLTRGLLISRLKAYGWILCHLPLMYRKHCAIQRMRCVKDREVLKNFTGALSHQEIANPLVDWVMNPLFSMYFFLIKRIIFW